jgi:hypothetical protein
MDIETASGRGFGHSAAPKIIPQNHEGPPLSSFQEPAVTSPADPFDSSDEIVIRKASIA